MNPRPWTSSPPTARVPPSGEKASALAFPRVDRKIADSCHARVAFARRRGRGPPADGRPMIAAQGTLEPRPRSSQPRPRSGPGVGCYQPPHSVMPMPDWLSPPTVVVTRGPPYLLLLHLQVNSIGRQGQPSADHEPHHNRIKDPHFNRLFLIGFATVFGLLRGDEPCPPVTRFPDTFTRSRATGVVPHPDATK